MPHTIEWSSEGSVISFSGDVSFQELREVGNAHYGDERLDVIKYVICDFSHADLSEISRDHAQTIASLDSITVGYKPQFKMAFVLRDDHTLQLCESYIEYSNNFKTSWDYRIFTDFADARDWCSEHRTD